VHTQRKTILGALAILAVYETALPFPVPKGGCPSGYYTSGSYCTPLNKDSRPAVPRPPGANCPSGWYQSGGACAKLNR
jgi:hypothetical protein